MSILHTRELFDLNTGAPFLPWGIFVPRAKSAGHKVCEALVLEASPPFVLCKTHIRNKTQRVVEMLLAELPMALGRGPCSTSAFVVAFGKLKSGVIGQAATQTPSSHRSFRSREVHPTPLLLQAPAVEPRAVADAARVEDATAPTGAASSPHRLLPWASFTATQSTRPNSGVSVFSRPTRLATSGSSVKRCCCCCCCNAPALTRSFLISATFLLLGIPVQYWGICFSSPFYLGVHHLGEIHPPPPPWPPSSYSPRAPAASWSLVPPAASSGPPAPRRLPTPRLLP